MTGHVSGDISASTYHWDMWSKNPGEFPRVWRSHTQKCWDKNHRKWKAEAEFKHVLLYADAARQQLAVSVCCPTNLVPPGNSSVCLQHSQWRWAEIKTWTLLLLPAFTHMLFSPELPLTFTFWNYFKPPERLELSLKFFVIGSVQLAYSRY